MSNLDIQLLEWLFYGHLIISPHKDVPRCFDLNSRFELSYLWNKMLIYEDQLERLSIH